MRFLKLLLTMSLLAASSSQAEVVRYDNNYLGVNAGISTLEDVEKVLGKPLEIQKTSNGHNYRFAKVVINISGGSQTLVNTITIDKDPTYQSETGFKLGDSLPTAPKKKGRSTWFDRERGIIYWLVDAKIQKIVLMAKYVH